MCLADAGPGKNLVQDDRDEKHALVVREVRDRQDRQPRLALWRVKQAAHVERVSFQPSRETRRCQQIVQLHCQSKALFGREKGLDVNHTDSLEWGGLDGVDQASQVQVVSRARHGRECSKAESAHGWKQDQPRHSEAPAVPKPPKRSVRDMLQAGRSRSPSVRQRNAARSVPARRCSPVYRLRDRRRYESARSGFHPHPTQRDLRAIAPLSARRTLRVSARAAASAGSIHG